MYVCNVKNVKVLRYANMYVMYVCVQDQDRVRKRKGEVHHNKRRKKERERGKKEYTPLENYSLKKR